LEGSIADDIFPKDRAIDDLEKCLDTHVLSVFRKYGGDKNKASAALGISLSALYRRLGKKNRPEIPL
jgi:transcriptional regulator with PAS, ATPase and Fis domain